VSTRRPNVFLIGAMKSATSYVAQALAAHPSIFVSEPREPCHFVDGEALRHFWPLMWRRGYWRSRERYLELFAGAGDARIVVDGSVVYSQAPLFSGVPERILDLCPDARFVYVLRDPVRRAISHYWHRVRHWGERRPMLKAISLDPEYAGASNYALQLETYLRHVDLGRFYVFTYESLVADPAGSVAGLYRWLGVDPGFRPGNLETPVNVTPDVIEYWPRLMQSLLAARFTSRLPAGLRDLASRLAVRRAEPVRYPAAEVAAHLRPRQRDETERLSRMLGRSFPEWTTLHADR